MRPLLVAFLALLVALAAKPLRPTTDVIAQRSMSVPAEGDEIVGPFASWSNAATTYGATGDGAADDTAALQRGLNDLGQTGHSPVLFLPRGTYRITRTLVLAFNINLSVVGDDPATTTIVWDGEPGGTMLSVNGIAYSRIARLTFDGRRRASIAVDQSWDGSHPHFDTGNEYSDDRFVDVEYGLHGGFKGHGFAEATIRRSSFVRNTRAGVALGNFNALDVWVWYSRFEDCYAGITNTPGAGNFHVYNSVFHRSTFSDLAISNTGGFSARGNYSVGSRAFFTSTGATNNPATIHIQRNTIVDPNESTVIRMGNQGPGVITDNVVRSLPAARAPVISWTSFIDADVASVGNTFTVTSPIRNNGRLVSIDDRVVPRTTINPVEPVLPSSLPNIKRQIFEVPAGADAGVIQNVILAAARQRGRRPVVHFANAIYSVAETLTLPAGDIQLAGDGYGTILRWTGTGAGPVLEIKGPSQVAIREMQIDGAKRADGIRVENADQPGARIYMDQIQLRAGQKTDLFVDGLDNTNVQLEDAGYAYSPNAVSIKVTGGPLSAAGRVTPGKTNIFSGASSGGRTCYDVSGGAKVLVRDLWYESGAGPGFASIHDLAVFTIDGARISSPANQTPAAFEISGLNGRFTILSTHIDDRILISGDGSRASVLGLGVFAEQRSSSYFVNAAQPPAGAMLVNARQLSILPGTRSTSTPDVGKVDPAFVRRLLAHTRGEQPAPLRALPNGVTDVRMFRVWVSNGLNNVWLRGQR